MKHLYIVRHGQSEANAADLYSPDDTELTELGKEQAAAINAQCEPLTIDAVLTSDLTRAKQTAELIRGDRDLSIVENTDLREIVHPSEIIDKRKDDEAVQDIVAQLRRNAEDPHWHYSDEENFVEFRERMLKVLIDLRERNEERMLVVTHSHALVMLTALILCGKYVEPDHVYRFEGVLVTDNTGITYVRIKDDLELEKAMELVTWNNLSHLSG